MDGTIGDPMSNEITKRTAVFVKSKLAGGKFKYTRKAWDLVEIGSRATEAKNTSFIQLNTGSRLATTRNFIGSSTVKADAVEQYDDIKIVDASEWAGTKANDINYTDL